MTQADPELVLALFDMHRRTRSMRLRVSSVTDGTAELAAKQAGLKARQTRLRMQVWNDEPDAPASSSPAPVDRRFIAELWVQRPDCVRREELCARDDEPRLAVYRAGSAWWWDRVRRGRELVGAAHPWMLGDELRLLLEPTTLLVGVELGGGPDRTVLGRRAGTVVLRPRPWRPFADPHLDTFSLGAEEVELWVDRARGLPLRVQARRGGQVLRTLAVGDLTLDVEHDPETFTLRPPDDAPFALAEEFMPHWTPRGRRVRQERTVGAKPEAG